MLLRIVVRLIMGDSCGENAKVLIRDMESREKTSMCKKKGGWFKDNWTYLMAVVCLGAVLILSVIWLNGMVSVLKSPHPNATIVYRYTNQPNLNDIDPVFKVYKEVEETLSGQMNTWLTIFGFFVTLFGLVVPLVSYLLQHRSLEDERGRVIKDAEDRQTSLRAEIEAAKRALEARTSDGFNEAMKEARGLICAAIENAEDSIGWELVKFDAKVKERFDLLERKFSTGNDDDKMEYSDEDYKRIWDAIRAKKASAQGVVGYMYAMGIGKDAAGNSIVKDVALAKKYWTLAAEQNEITSQRNLGIVYYLDEDYTNSLFWRRRAAENGDVDSACDCAYMLEFGEGCDVDEEAAVSWYKKAINGGSALAKGNLGEMYEFARGGLKKDLLEAEKLYREARGGNLPPRIAKEVNKCLERVSEKIAKRS